MRSPLSQFIRKARQFLEQLKDKPECIEHALQVLIGLSSFHINYEKRRQYYDYDYAQVV